MEKYKIDEIHCREYLVDGQLKKWEGDTSEVFSTIDIKEGGEYSPTLLGSIPDMDSDSAIEALESAKKAFNRGQGKWPTMKVRDRLKCMKRFADKMQEHRDVVVKLLMWEIGKNQTRETIKILNLNGFNKIKIVKDLSGKNRCIISTKI